MLFGTWELHCTFAPSEQYTCLCFNTPNRATVQINEFRKSSKPSSTNHFIFPYKRGPFSPSSFCQLSVTHFLLYAHELDPMYSLLSTTMRANHNGQFINQVFGLWEKAAADWKQKQAQWECANSIQIAVESRSKNRSVNLLWFPGLPDFLVYH